MGHGGSKSCREKSCRYTFFRKSPRVESQQQATEGKGGDVRGATCHNSGMQAHRHGEERGDAELIVYARGSEIKGARRTDPLLMNPLCIVILSRNSFRSSLAVPHSTTVAPTLFTPTVLTPTLFTPPAQRPPQTATMIFTNTFAGLLSAALAVNTVAASIYITSPVAGTTAIGGQVINIAWRKSGNSSSLSLE